MSSVKPCSICKRSLGINKNPEFTTTCRHRFHQKCVEQHIKTENSYECPDCGKQKALKNIQQESSSSSSSSSEEAERGYLPNKSSKQNKKKETSASSEEEETQRYSADKNSKQNKKKETSASSSEEEETQRYSADKNSKQNKKKETSSSSSEEEETQRYSADKNSKQNKKKETSASSEEEETQRYSADKNSKQNKKKETSASSEEEETQRYSADKNSKQNKKKETSASSEEEETQRYSADKNSKQNKKKETSSSSSEEEETQRYSADKNSKQNKKKETSSSSSEEEERGYSADKSSKQNKKKETSASSEEEERGYSADKSSKPNKKKETSAVGKKQERSDLPDKNSKKKNEYDDFFNSLSANLASGSQPGGNEWTCKKCQHANQESATVCTNCNRKRHSQSVKKKETPSKHDKSPYKKVDYDHSSTKSHDDDDDEKEKDKHKSTKNKHASKYEDKSKPSSKKAKSPPRSTKRSIPVHITITDLPAEYNDDEKIENHIRGRIKNAQRIDVIKVKYYSQLGVGVVYVQSDDDKDQLINEVGKLTWKAKQDQSFISFEDTIEFESYVVLDVPDEKIDDDLPTAEDVRRQWRKTYNTEKPHACKQLNTQFPNMYRVVTTSLEEIVANLEQQDMVVKHHDAQVYFCSKCSFFEELPKSITKKQLTDAITKAIQPAELSPLSFHIQLNKKTATACVIATDAVRQWSTLSFIELNNKTFSKKNSLACRLVVQPVPTDISIEAVLKNPIFKGKAKKLKLLGETLILEVSDQSTYDTCIEVQAVRIDSGKKARMKAYDPSDHVSGNEIDGETWYDSEMGNFDPDITQFTKEFNHEIFRLKWNAKIWREQFENAAPENYRLERGQRGQQDRRGMRPHNRRNLLQMTVMLNTLAVIRDKKYLIKNREIPLNLNKTMKTIVYNHRSKLIKSFKMPIRSTPFKETKVRVVNNDCIAAYRTLLNTCKNPLLLNMANSKTPGGGYRKGENAQEENLFRRSDYYRSLDAAFDSNKQLPRASERFRCTNDCQIEPLPPTHNMYPIEEFGAIYTSGLTIFRHSQDVGYEYMEEPLINVAAIAVAAFRDPKLDGEYLDNETTIGTRRKIENIFAIAHNQRHDSLVLSAFGCGAFHNPPGHIAQIFRSVIDQYAGYFDTIVFAILDDHNAGQELNPHGNHKPFADLLDGKTFLPAKSMDKPNTKHGSYRISTDGSFVYDVCMNREDICNKGVQCSKIFEHTHAREFIHPPMCNYAASNGRCDLKSDRVHMNTYIHMRFCSYGGQCEKIKDEKHCQEFSHPSNCSDGGSCINMDVNHLKEFLHIPLCTDGPKCLLRKTHDKKHCESYRHCITPCQYGGQCLNIHDRSHIAEFGHPFTSPCSMTPFHCQFYTTLSEATDANKCDTDVQDHCLDRSHVCRFGRNCKLDSTVHRESTIHIIRRLCSYDDKCERLHQEEHLNSYSHSKLADIRRLCQYGSRCHELQNLDHVTKFRHARTDENIGVVQLYHLNDGLNFVRNQCENIRQIQDYAKKQGWKPLPTSGIPRKILDYFRTVQPVHRCSPFIFESILLHGHVMSRDYMENLKKTRFVATSVMQHSRVRGIDGMNIPQYQKAAKEYITEIVREEFARAKFPPSDHAAPAAAAADGSHLPLINPTHNEYHETAKSMHKIVKKTFSKADLEVMKNKAIEIAQASIKLHSNPAGIGHAPDKELGTHKRVFSILGPHLGHYYGDVFLVFKREILHHPDADFSMCAATTFGKSGNAYKWRPWLTDPSKAEDRIKHYHRTKLHASTPGFEYAIALELMAVTSLHFKLNSMDISLEKIFERWISVDSHHNIEGHLPQLIPIDYIEHIYVAQNIYDTFSAQTIQALNAGFRNRYTIMKHKGLTSGNPMGSAGPTPAEKDRVEYQKAVIDELMKQYTHNVQYGVSRPVQGTVITIPATNFDKCFSLPLTISQAHELYRFEKGHDPTEDIAYIYWQTINGEMMLVLSKEPEKDDDSSMVHGLLCYISPKCDSHDHDYHEQATYISIGEPIQHHKFVKKHKFKAYSNKFHIGSNTDDYITYCLELHRSKGRVILYQAGSNAIYNHEQISCEISSKDLTLSELEYISVTSDTKEVSIRNLFVTFERQADLHPTFDQDFKKPPSLPKKTDDSHAAAASSSSAAAVSSFSSSSSSSVQCCSNNVNCVIQYMTDAEAKAHMAKYSHPCRFSELCLKKEPHLTHEPHNVPKCKNDGHCNKLGDPYHRAEYRHTDLPDFLIPCRNKACSDKSDNHLIKYSHGEKVYALKESKSSSKSPQPIDPRTPCKWGTKCKEIADQSHRARFSHRKPAE